MSALSFKMCVGILHGPVDFFLSSESIIFLISSVSVGLRNREFGITFFKKFSILEEVLGMDLAMFGPMLTKKLLKAQFQSMETNKTNLHEKNRFRGIN